MEDIKSKGEIAESSTINRQSSESLSILSYSKLTVNEKEYFKSLFEKVICYVFKTDVFFISYLNCIFKSKKYSVSGNNISLIFFDVWFILHEIYILRKISIICKMNCDKVSQSINKIEKKLKIN